MSRKLMSSIYLLIFTSTLVSSNNITTNTTTTPYPTCTDPVGPANFSINATLGCNTTFYGRHLDGVERFLGIQYGSDTGGQNRFKPATKYEYKANSEVNATIWGPLCPQQIYWDDPWSRLREDCLRLNVWRTNGTKKGDRRAVMIFIHGGSFVSGSKDDSIYNSGGMLLKALDNGLPIIHVTLNYRLGVFGFAQSESLRREGSENAGLRDIRLAIEWVRDNIEAFGGDPSMITIHGQSSGGVAVGFQLLAYGGSKPLPFQRAIGQSQILEQGVDPPVWTMRAMERLHKASPCSNSTEFGSAKMIQCFRDLSLHDLIEAQNVTQLDGPEANTGDEWLPSVDGDFLPARPSELILSGRIPTNISLIMGWTNDDMAPFTRPFILNTAQDFTNVTKYIFPNFSPQSFATIEKLYPESDFRTHFYPNGTIQRNATFYRTTQLMTDVFMVCIPIFFGQALHKAAGNHVWLYHHNQTVFQKFLVEGYGVVHTSELPYVNGNFSNFLGDPEDYGAAANWTSDDDRLLERQTRSWSSFAAVGRPEVDGKKTLKGWKEADFGDNSFGVYVIGGPNEGYSGKGGAQGAREGILKFKWEERCGFWNSEVGRYELGW